MSQLHNDFFTDLDRLRVFPAPADLKQQAAPKRLASTMKPQRIKGEFLKGPIPLAWLSPACGLDGKAVLSVSLAIWFEAGRRQSEQIKLTTAILDRFHVNRKAKYRALELLEQAGLIAVCRQERKNPVVTILMAQPQAAVHENGQAGNNGAI
jgi:hypothetical protein